MQLIKWRHNIQTLDFDQHQDETIAVSRALNEEGMFVKSETHGADRGQKEQRKTSHNILKEIQ